MAGLTMCSRLRFPSMRLQGSWGRNLLHPSSSQEVSNLRLPRNYFGTLQPNPCSRLPDDLAAMLIRRAWALCGSFHHERK